MPEEVKTPEVKKEEPKKKGPLGKLKEKAEDSEEQLAIVSTFVRLGILIWSGGILTLNYVTIPSFHKARSIRHLSPVSLQAFLRRSAFRLPRVKMVMVVVVLLAV